MKMNYSPSFLLHKWSLVGFRRQHVDLSQVKRDELQFRHGQLYTLHIDRAPHERSDCIGTSSRCVSGDIATENMMFLMNHTSWFVCLSLKCKTWAWSKRTLPTFLLAVETSGLFSWSWFWPFFFRLGSKFHLESSFLTFKGPRLYLLIETEKGSLK